MNSLMESWPRKHRITVVEYCRMAEVGLLAPDARVELIDGEIFDMAPIGVDHAYVVDRLTETFIATVRDRVIVRTQGPVLLDEGSMPQPDLVILERRADLYRHRHPAPADVLLVIEVSDSTLDNDRDVKGPLYARHGIPEYWIVDIPHRELLWYRAPQDGGYTQWGSIREPAAMQLAALPGTSIDLTKVLSG